MGRPWHSKMLRHRRQWSGKGCAKPVLTRPGYYSLASSSKNVDQQLPSAAEGQSEEQVAFTTLTTPPKHLGDRQLSTSLSPRASTVLCCSETCTDNSFIGPLLPPGSASLQRGIPQLPTGRSTVMEHGGLCILTPVFAYIGL